MTWLVIFNFILSVNILWLYIFFFNVIEVSFVSLPCSVSSFFLLVVTVMTSLFVYSDSVIRFVVTILFHDWTQDLCHVTSWMMVARLVFDLFIIKCDVLVDLPICFYLYMFLLWNHLSCLLVDNMLLMIILFVQLSVGELKLNQ